MVDVTRRIFLLILSYCCFLQVEAQQEDEYAKLLDDFGSPPSQAYPIVYHWWLGGHVDTLRLKEELRSFKNAGISGFTIFEIGSNDTVLVGAGPAFLSDESLETIRFAVEEAGKLGLEVGLNSASSWNAGGNWLPPQHAAKSIYQTKVSLEGGKEVSVKIPFPEIPEVDPRGRKRLIEYIRDGKPVYSEEIAVLALPQSDNLADTANILNYRSFLIPRQKNWNGMLQRATGRSYAMSAPILVKI